MTTVLLLVLLVAVLAAVTVDILSGRENDRGPIDVQHSTALPNRHH